jgi:glucan 1,3-beta-glucosidase
MTTQQRLRRGEIPCRGANLGGWLVAEHWITWDSVIWQDVPEDISHQGEFATMQFLGHDKGDPRFEEHRATWITETDMDEIKQFGLNTVRVPVGFWIMPFDPTDISNKRELHVFAPGAVRFLDRLINEWCAKRDLAVLVDIHGAKGSQNGRDHSAPPTCGVKYWCDYPENVDNTVQFAQFLADRYRDSPAFLGIGLLNEPEYPMNPETVREYYKRAYHKIRSTGNDCVLVTAPMLTEQCPPVMDDLLRFPQFTNVWHEWHPYFIWGYEGQSADQIINAVNKYAEQIKAWRGNWLLISEWSLGAPDSAFPADDRQKLKQFADAQLAAFAHAHAGWTFWTWKHVDDKYKRPTGWSMRQLLRDGVLQITP